MTTSSVSPRSSRRLATSAPYALACPAAAVDAQGHVVLAARFQKPPDLPELGGLCPGGEPGEVFVLKLDGEGRAHWCERIAGTALASASWNVAADPRDGGVYVAGESGQGTVLIKYSGAGARVWDRCISNIISHKSDGYPLGLAVTEAGNVLVFGRAGADRESPVAQVFLLRFDASGFLLWRRCFAHTGRVRHPQVAVDAEGAAVVSGHFRGSIAFDRTPIEITSAWDLYVAKVNHLGDLVWSKRLDGKYTSSFGVGVDAANNIVVAGDFQREIDLHGVPRLSTDGARALFVAVLAPDGRLRSARRYLGDRRSQFELRLAVDRDGSVLLAGTLEGVLDLGAATLRGLYETESLFVARLDASGEPAWSHVIEGPYNQAGVAIDAGPEGSGVLVGSFTGRVDLGGEELWSEGSGFDLFVARLGGRT